MPKNIIVCQRCFLKKSDREYYDLEITEDHQKLYDQYVSGDLKTNKILKNN